MQQHRPIRLYIFDADVSSAARLCRAAVSECAGDWELIPGVRERLAQIDWDEGRSFGIALIRVDRNELPDT